MLFHQPDRTYRRLFECWKRSFSFAPRGSDSRAINATHPLAIQWSNCQMMLSGAPDYVAVSRNPKKKHWHDVRRAMDGAADIVMLDWMALKVDEFAVNNILVGDETVGEVLRQWRSRMPFNPALMVGNRDKRWAL